jgi:predicted flap endonuclease-1-like 5' DNA nuclease
VIVHFVEVWLLMVTAFVAGGIAGVLIYEGLARTALASTQIAVADAVAGVGAWIREHLGGSPAGRRVRRYKPVVRARPAAARRAAPVRRPPPPEPFPADDEDDEEALAAWFEENAPLEDEPGEEPMDEEAWEELPPPEPVRERSPGATRPPMPPPPDRAPPPERAAPPERITPPPRRPPQLPPPNAYRRPLEDDDLDIDMVRAEPDSPDMRRPAMLAEPRNGVPDNLQRIRGIGERNEVRLNKLGIFHFSQIAAWTPAEIRWIGRHLAFPERIDRDDWVGQAIVLASGGETGFTKASERRRERRRLGRGGEVLGEDVDDPDDDAS